VKCSKCKSKACVETPFGERHYCDRHFLESIEKRVRKELRTKQKLDVKKEYFIFNDGSHEFELTKHFLKEIFNNRLKLKLTKQESKAQIFPCSLDSETSGFLESFLDDKDYKKKRFMPLIVVSQAEMEELCRIKKIKYKEKKFNGILDELESDYPGTKFSTLKTLDSESKK